MTKEMKREAEILAERPYLEIAFRDDTTTGGYVYMAINPELDGCIAQGESLKEARENLKLFRIDYIFHLLENNLPVPDLGTLQSTIIRFQHTEIPYKADLKIVNVPMAV